MKVGIAYAVPKRQVWLTVEVPDGSSIQEAIDRSGVLVQFPDIDLTQQKVGVFGKVVPLNTALAEGDRIEIYRPLTADPKAIKARMKAEGKADPVDP
ncbi:MAG TPA: RnfH family protein [Lamprocystis sp. (in: g-proteobacteria)]|nr:RnfH family protein [Lamprocystis sp. (in: g-proteobacteria)]